MGLEKLGDLVSAIDVDSVDASHLDELLKERPHLLQQLSKAQKVTLYTKVYLNNIILKLLYYKVLYLEFYFFTNKLVKWGNKNN